MKRTDLEKNLGLKINNKLKGAAVPGRFGAQGAAEDRREKRKQDQAAGLIPFAVKLDKQLAEKLRSKAKESGIGLDELVGKMLQDSISG